MARVVNLSALFILCIAASVDLCSSSALKGKRGAVTVPPQTQEANATCICGVFLSGQVVGGYSKSVVGSPAITVDVEEAVTCGGYSQCSTRCLEEMVKFLPTSASIICGSVDRDVHKEKAHLFVNVCNQGWHKSRISTQKEVCCKNSVDYKCPPV